MNAEKIDGSHFQMPRTYSDPRPVSMRQNAARERYVESIIDRCVEENPGVPRAEFEAAVREYGVAVTRPHEHWCAVCGIGLGGDA